LQSTQSQVGGNYDVKVTCSVAGVNYSTVIHVVGATYPSNMYIACSNLGNVAPRTVDKYIEFYTSGMKASLYASADEDYTAKINKITYTITNKQSGDSVQYNSYGADSQLKEFRDDYLTLSGGGVEGGIIVSADTAMPSDESIQLYDFNADVLFISGRKMQVKSTVVVTDDVVPIILST